jgi:hypothetical protein
VEVKVPYAEGPAWGRSILLAALVLLTGVLGCGRLLAQESPPPSGAAVKASQPANDHNRFWTTGSHFNWGLQLGYALECTDPLRPSHVNLLYAQPQLGIIVADVHARRVPLSRFEIVNEGLLGNAIHPGGRLAGYVLLFRLDGRPRGRTVPFFDMGAGVLNTTLSDRVRELNGHTQFNPQAGLGLQYFFRPQRALVVEYRYLHMSNNAMQGPNLGFNSNMLSVGFRWLPRPRSTVPPHSNHSHNLFRRLLVASQLR